MSNIIKLDIVTQNDLKALSLNIKNLQHKIDLILKTYLQAKDITKGDYRLSDNYSELRLLEGNDG